jgi:hypothetical protein
MRSLASYWRMAFDLRRVFVRSASTLEVVAVLFITRQFGGLFGTLLSWKVRVVHQPRRCCSSLI